jgi:hypothetical protein
VTPGVCNKQCGGGTATDTVVCKRNDGVTVADSNCAGTKPPTTRTCNTQSCPVVYTYAWEPQPWTACSKTCGGGLQTRAVACKRNDGVYVDQTYCNPATKPVLSQACNTTSCPTGHHVNQNQYVTPAMNSVDVILIVDDSGSMEEDNSKLSHRLNTLVSDLDALNVDYHMCITTTDTSYWHGSPAYWIGLNKQVILDKNTPNKNKIFIDTMNAVGTMGSSDERGIFALNSMMANFDQTGCIRSEASLATILISDEDERSVGGIAALSSSQYRALEPGDTPANVIANVHNKYDSQNFVKSFLWNSIIVKPGDTACQAKEDAQISPSFYGRLYAQLSNLTGGYAGSICSADYTQHLRYIKDRIVNSLAGMKLQCVPVGSPVVTFSQPVTTNVTVVGDTLKFLPVIPEGVTIHASYNCP